MRYITTPLMVLSLSCGGLSGAGHEAARGGSGGASPAGAAGATAGAPSGGSIGVEVCSEETRPECLENCQLMGDVSLPGGTCEEGVWRCPEGTTPFEECPPGTCLVHYTTCCEPLSGMGFSPTCGPSGYAEVCPVGSVRLTRGTGCVRSPGQACGETPSDTDGQPCPIEMAACVYGPSCGATVCQCERSDGGLVWSCLTNAC